MNETMNPALPILLVDDEKSWLRSLSITLERAGGFDNVIDCQDSREVMKILAEKEVSLILLDITMPHLTGDELLQTVLRDYPDTPVIINSGRDQADIAVKCMKAGAFDYFVKSMEEERFIAGVRRALSMAQLQKENQQLKTRVLQDKLEKPEAFAEIVTGNKRMRAAFQYIEAVAGSTEPVLITGESGVGKELIARAVRQVGRPGAPWVTVNVAGLDDNHFSDTLFGHTKGAFTGADRARPGMIEQASGGTLFLDEIGDLSLPSQVKLLRLLQEGEYLPLGSDRPRRSNARIVVATNHDLEQRQASGDFRKDLYYRLRAHRVHLPPLRERPEDIPLLLDHFLTEAAENLGKKKPTPPEELPVLLSTFHFPGNIRELRAMVFDAVSVHQSGKLSMSSFKKAIGMISDEAGPVKDAPPAQEQEALVSFSEKLPSIEATIQLLVAESMRRAKGNQTIAAGLLGISRPALSKRLKKLAE